MLAPVARDEAVVLVEPVEPAFTHTHAALGR
jgi:hypothetical protein